MQPKTSAVGRKRNAFIEAARRAQIIQAATETVAQVGYAQASLSRIAQHARISKSVISYHFAGKDELLEQVVTQIFDEGWALIEPRLATARTEAERLRVHIEVELEYWESNRTRFLAMASIVDGHRTSDGKPRFADKWEETVTVVEDLLRKGQENGEFRDFDPRVVAVTVRQGIEGALDQWARNPDLDLKAYTAELITLFELAIRK
ncbi:TetR/AcrR family transcriptional regulator [Nocardiopsis gilva YIM 90087]|uniref:TetR/AcrR family transcriptional regulator n=1 Tax=Nocardiopsis gilva YIM 90087 TaxID=1235441 RepID=A0A223S299_9ACTN|nr:TetR/AcrR family transcriptional regulator [Nocardiopsis gilva]ASU82238.1 TetR/AcrR family transcriptional regulator [Nocardiopsis gilva YIM 90087]